MLLPQARRIEMHVNELPQIFRDCVAKEDGRYSISKPFIAGGYIYATDGRICVRMPVPPDGIDGLDASTKNPDPSTVGWEGPFHADASPVPELTPDETKDCVCCGGQGIHRCEVECADCDGTGEITEINATPVGICLLGNNYLRILAANEAAIYMRKDGKRERVVRFAGDGWDGLLMPRTPQ
jgi:hypothetical protein